MTLKPRLALASYMACSSGISKRHRPHQVAQTLTRTTLPFCEAMSNGAPSSVFAASAGIGSPTLLGALGVSDAGCAALAVVAAVVVAVAVVVVVGLAAGVSALWQVKTATASNSAVRFIVPHPAWWAP